MDTDTGRGLRHGPWTQARTVDSDTDRGLRHGPWTQTQTAQKVRIPCCIPPLTTMVTSISNATAKAFVSLFVCLFFVFVFFAEKQRGIEIRRRREDVHSGVSTSSGNVSDRGRDADPTRTRRGPDAGSESTLHGLAQQSFPSGQKWTRFGDANAARPPITWKRGEPSPRRRRRPEVQRNPAGRSAHR